MAFKMKGSSLYGKINLNRGGNKNRPDGRPKSSAFQKTEDEPTMKVKGPEVTITADKAKRERDEQKFKRTKAEASAMQGDEAMLGKVTEEYGGTWKRKRSNCKRSRDGARSRI